MTVVFHSPLILCKTNILSLTYNKPILMTTPISELNLSSYVYWLIDEFNRINQLKNQSII